MSGRSSCPECGTILRIRDRSFLGRRVNCPECKTTLKIATEEPQGNFVARRLTPDELASGVRHGPGGRKAPRDKILLPDPPKKSIFGRLIDSPLTAAWLLAIASSSLVAVLALAPKYRFAARPGSSASTPDAQIQPLRDAGKPQIDPTNSIDDVVEVLQPTVVVKENEFDNLPVSAIDPTNVNESQPESRVEVTVNAKPELAIETTSLPIKIDITTKLAQKLTSYKQTKPVSRRDLIEALQEQLNAPILYDNDDLGVEDLDETIKFELEKTTVGEVIQKVADLAGWEVHIEETGLRLTRK